MSQTKETPEQVAKRLLKIIKDDYRAREINAKTEYAQRKIIYAFQRCAELEDALRPFGELNKVFQSDYADSMPVGFGKITIGDLRRAKNVLQKK